MRLDAFAYAPKAPGKKNFLNDPETWEFLQQIHELAAPLGLTLLPEIHAAYEEKIYKTLADKGYATYDFFLPGLVLMRLRTGEQITLQNGRVRLWMIKSPLSICLAVMTAYRFWI